MTIMNSLYLHLIGNERNCLKYEIWLFFTLLVTITPPFGKLWATNLFRSEVTWFVKPWFLMLQVNSLVLKSDRVYREGIRNLYRNQAFALRVGALRNDLELVRLWMSDHF
ncbi:MAG: hypothetical protein CM1200mP39_09130 [Dehalococcoidia bacterium]|nr:MAG: hypothetical protein CM1200mP39_09130 [Dehalococcoidia bacterium]